MDCAENHAGDGADGVAIAAEVNCLGLGGGKYFKQTWVKIGAPIGDVQGHWERVHGVGPDPGGAQLGAGGGVFKLLILPISVSVLKSLIILVLHKILLNPGVGQMNNALVFQRNLLQHQLHTSFYNLLRARDFIFQKNLSQQR